MSLSTFPDFPSLYLHLSPYIFLQIYIAYFFIHGHELPEWRNNFVSIFRPYTDDEDLNAIDSGDGELESSGERDHHPAPGQVCKLF